MTHAQLLQLQSAHPDHIYLLAQGAFYHAYEQGAYRLNALLGYKVRPTPHGDMAGFPISSIDDVLARIIKNQANRFVYSEPLPNNHLVIKIEQL